MSESEDSGRTISVAGVVAVLALGACLLLTVLLVVVTLSTANHRRVEQESVMRWRMAEQLAAQARATAVAQAAALQQELKAERVRRVQAELRAEQAERTLKELQRVKEP